MAEWQLARTARYEGHAPNQEILCAAVMELFSALEHLILSAQSPAFTMPE